MAIVNRDLDSSQQLYIVQRGCGAVATGVSTWVGAVPSPGQILGVQLTGKGLSAVPVYQLAIARWTSAGITRIALGSAMTLAVAFGTSGGMIGQSFAANGSLSAVQAGDVLTVNSSGADTAVTDLIVSVVIKATQDIKQSHGMS
jgi:hypothetical protein